MTGEDLDAHKARWDTEGWTLLPGFLPADDIEAARAVLPTLFPTAEDFASDRDPERNRPWREDSHAVLPPFPFESDALNHLALHERLMDLAECFLDNDDLRLYQAMVSAKYSDGPAEDEQLLHADYGNHTLVVPRADPGFQHLELFVYLSDVTPETAATRMVPLGLTGDIPVERTYLAYDEYPHLYRAEVPASGPAGSVLAYRSDVYHRGVRMTAPGAARFLLHVAFKPAGTDWLGFQAWPAAAEAMAWHAFMAGATVRQACMLGFPAPGHPYWDADTLRGVAARYPNLDMTPWRVALSADR